MSERETLLEQAVQLLQDALARTTGNFELAIRGVPVRDMAETLAEARHAQAMSELALLCSAKALKVSR